MAPATASVLLAVTAPVRVEEPDTLKASDKVVAPETVKASDKVVAPDTAKVSDKVVAAVTPSVPAIAVLPVAAATVNLLVLMSKSPSMPVAPVTANVEPNVVAQIHSRHQIKLWLQQLQVCY